MTNTERIQLHNEMLRECIETAESLPDAGGGTAQIEEKDVTFIDYDGTILHSYSFEEAEVLTEMPPLPEQEGLTCQGWNGYLPDIKVYAARRQKVYVGAMYITDDGKTRVYITLLPNTLSPQVRFATTGTVLIDWGDGSTTTVTGTSQTSAKTAAHEYASAGDYIITYEVQNGGMYLLGSSSSGAYLMYSSDANLRRSYQATVRKIELGANTYCNANYSLGYFGKMETITLPSGLTSLGAGILNYCYSLKSLVVPKTVLSDIAIRNSWSLQRISLSKGIIGIGDNGFRDSALTYILFPDGFESIGPYAFFTTPLKNVVIPESVDTIDAFAFSACYLMETVVISNGACVIAADAFSNCYTVLYFDFTRCTSVPTLESADAFDNVSPLCEFRVPAALYDEWVAATNWSAFAEQIIAV